MRIIPGVLVLVALARTAMGQVPDSIEDPARAARLRQAIEERFGDRLREELGLTSDQTTKLRVSLAGLAARRRSMEQEERQMRQALAAQLRPGIAANSDSVAHLVDALTTHRIAYAQTFRDEMRELSTILNPVQRGQYLLLRDRLLQRVLEIQQGRTQNQLPPRRLRRP